MRKIGWSHETVFVDVTLVHLYVEHKVVPISTLYLVHMTISFWFPGPPHLMKFDHVPLIGSHILASVDFINKRRSKSVTDSSFLWILAGHCCP